MKPLVSRPPYGYDRAPSASSGLPGGGPSAKGRSMSDSSGTSTFVKPLDDHGTDDPAPEQSLYRTDGPREVGKRQDDGDDTIDNSDASPGYMGLGDKDPNDYSKTKYPYRDGKPNTKNAAIAHWVAQLYLLAQAPVRVLRPLSRIAATAEQILAGLNPKFVERAQSLSPQLKRVDVKNLRWIFSVPGSQGNVYAVKIKAIRPRANITKLAKMDLELSCTCPAWQWQGPEYHAKQEDYLLTKPMGTASTPDIRDPERQNFVCKHVAAVLVTTQDWQVPAGKKKAPKKKTPARKPRK